MDTFDAILDHLKRAQQRGVDTVTTQMDAVVDRMEALLREAKSSIENAIPSDCDEFIPLADVKKAVEELRNKALSFEEKAKSLAERVEELEAQEAPAQAVPSGGISLDLLRTLDKAKSQSELLKGLLPVLTQYSGRAVVLVIRGSGINAWSGIGFDNAESLRGWTATDLSASPALSSFIADNKPVRFSAGNDPIVSEWLGDEAKPIEAVIIPVSLRGKIMGGIYVDRLEGQSWDPKTAQSLVAMGCWMIDTLHHRTEGDTPMLAELVDFVDETTAALEQEAPAFEEPEPEFTPEPVPEPEPEPEFTPEPEPVLEPEPEPEETSFDPSATMRVDVDDAMFAEAAAADVTPEPEPEPEPVPAPGPVPVSAVVPPPPEPEPETTSDSGIQISPEDEAKHEEARRFARLLVSEIKLYNEDEVNQGRANNNLYHRLKEDIDRSREMFEKRIPPEILEARDYFQDELVRILADGDVDALGM